MSCSVYRACAIERNRRARIREPTKIDLAHEHFRSSPSTNSYVPAASCPSPRPARAPCPRPGAAPLARPVTEPADLHARSLNAMPTKVIYKPDSQSTDEFLVLIEDASLAEKYMKGGKC